MKQQRAMIKNIATYFPKTILTNEQLAEEFGDWDAIKIYSKTGIAERNIVGEDECASDLGYYAAEKLFENNICQREEIDFILFCTQSPDYFLPTTACLLQARLGLKDSCGAMDYNLGCSGFVYGLALAKSLIETNMATNVLLITAETYSKFINLKDRSVRTLFGDGAAATLVSSTKAEHEIIGPFIFGTNGKGANNLIVPAGGLRKPSNLETNLQKEDSLGNWRSEENLYMNGPEIFNFTIEVVPRTVKKLLEVAELDITEIDYFIFHQASKLVLDHLQRKLRIPGEKFCLDLEHHGNTVSATIPIALQNTINRQNLKLGDKVMLVGYGVGLSWAATIIEIV